MGTSRYSHQINQRLTWGSCPSPPPGVTPSIRPGPRTGGKVNVHVNRGKRVLFSKAGLTAAAAAVGLSAMLVTGASAQVAPPPAGLIYSCVDKSGVITIVTQSTSCPKNSTAVNWNATGPQGPTGPAGPMGPQGPQGD